MECNSDTDTEKTVNKNKGDDVVLELSALQLDTEKSRTSKENNKVKTELISIDDEERKHSVDSGSKCESLCELNNEKNKSGYNTENNKEKEIEYSKDNEDSDIEIEVDERISEKETQEILDVDDCLISEKNDTNEKKEELLESSNITKESERVEDNEKEKIEEENQHIMETSGERNEDEKTECNKEIRKETEYVDISDDEDDDIEEIKEIDRNEKVSDKYTKNNNEKLECSETSDEKENGHVGNKENEEMDVTELCGEVKKNVVKTSDKDENNSESDDREEKKSVTSIEKTKDDDEKEEKDHEGLDDNKVKETDVLEGDKKNSKKTDEFNDNKKDEPSKTTEAIQSEDGEDKDSSDKQSDDEDKQSHSREKDDENEMDVDDPDPYPEHINFVDVNATNIDSPMVIDDDDDDDDIVMIERKKGSSSPEIVVQGELRKKRQEIVIDLDDDDDDIEIETIKKRKKRDKSSTPKKGVNCCNIECSGLGLELRSAPVFVLTYFGRKFKKGKAEKVCQECFEKAMEHQEHMSYVLAERKPLMKIKFQPRNDTVVLTDSDEEGSDEEEPLPEDVLADLEEQLKEVMESTLENYDLNFQVDESKNILTHKMDELSVAFKETDDLLNELQRKMDSMRHDVYKDYTPKIRELPALTIDDSQCGSRQPIIRLSPPRVIDSIRPNQYSRQQNQTMQRTLSTTVTPTASPVKHTYTITPSSSAGSSPSDILRKSPIAGVATKKVTQIQRSVFPGTSSTEMRQEDVVALEQIEITHKPLPPIGNLLRPKPRTGDVMYVMKLSFYGVWARAKILEVVPKGTELTSGSVSLYNMYKVKFESSYRKSNPVKQVTGKQMAYTTPNPVRFPVGTRVIAIFQDNDWSKECYYSGVIAEPPKSMNKYRYLVFFDDGYAQYVSHEKILLVCESSRNVWEDIHPDSREFIRKYLEQYPERPMVKLQQGQIVKTEWNGKWWIARVVEVDGSLVKMHFDADGRTEWIYRGSTRLGPLYAELAHAAARKEQGTFSRFRGLGVASLKKRNMPYVEYTRGTDGEELRRDDSGDGHGHSSESTPSRAVAKKSTTKRPDSITERYGEQPQPTPVEKSQQPQGNVEFLQLNASRRRPAKFEPHQCGPNCLSGTEYDPKAMKGENPLVIPMLSGWERQVNRCRGKRVVIYRAPCGRRLRNMEELHRYLRVTKSKMAVDLFDFDFWVHCFAEFVLEKGFSNIKDLSYGSEHVPVPCVNCVDHSLPDYVSYSTKRDPTDGVDLNLDPEFLTGCDCTDDCQDRDKCACWQLTIQGTAYGPGGVVDPTVGYIYRRLPEPVMTGIYECNSRCRCSNTCLNRVAQQPLQLKLQVFKTETRGWGIRCLNDIPQGGFICIYAGRLLTEQGANEGGKNYGDEYLAELDYIEVVEKLKEGYESDVVEEDEEENNDSDQPSEEKGVSEARKSKAPVQADSGLSEEEEEEAENSQEARDSDEDFRPQPWVKGRGSTTLPEQSSIRYRTRLRNRASRHGSEDSQHEQHKEKEDSGREKDKDVEKESDSRRKPSRSVSSSDHNYSDDEDNEQLRLPSRFAAVSEPSDKSKKPKNRSVREFFGNDEYCYIMDAKNNGNIGRYLNHSCSPNVFVQNVFVDTHDLRFPWVAFFALTYIHAGTELTWDYNYDVGSVPGKVLHCYCGSNDCRGRLL